MQKLISHSIAEKLLEIKAVFLRPNDPFTWTSGMQSPIYCDNRISLSDSDTRTLIKESFVKLIHAKFPDAQCIAGVATAGIPQATLVADALNLPMVYVRSSAKGHGRENLIEGKLEAGSKVVVIEDLVSTGGSSLEATKHLQAEGAQVLGLASIFTYGFKKATDSFKAAGIEYHSLSNYDDLIEIALDKKYIAESDLKLLQDWKAQF